jgi:hypothetical protein
MLKAMRKLTPLTKTILIIGGSISLSYTGYIEYRNNLIPVERDLKLFGPGTADEILTDNLKSGDVVLFSRRWYNYHIPAAICIKMYQMIHKTEYDHCGVIICDNDGVPSLYELSLYGRLTIEPFSNRILRSKAHQIVLVPIFPRTDFSTAERLRLVKYARDEVLVSNAFPECVSLGLGILYSGFLSIFGEEIAPKFISKYLGKSFECPNAQIVLDCWHQLDIDLKDQRLQQRLTCMEILNGDREHNLNLVYKKAAAEEALTLGHNILIRTY